MYHIEMPEALKTEWLLMHACCVFQFKNVDFHLVYSVMFIVDCHEKYSANVTDFFNVYMLTLVCAMSLYGMQSFNKIFQPKQFLTCFFSRSGNMYLVLCNQHLINVFSFAKNYLSC